MIVGGGDDNNGITAERPRDASTQIQSHWTAKPVWMLLAVLAAKLLLFQAGLGFSLPMALGDTGPGLSVLLGLAPGMAALLIGGLFYWLAGASRRRTVSWKVEIAFWVGLALTVGYCFLFSRRFLLARPLLALSDFWNTLASGLADALFIVLLVPVLEKRYGIVSGALAAAASFALLSALETLADRGTSLLLFAAQGNGGYSRYLWTDFIPSLLSGMIIAAAVCVLRIALYRLASRRIPGAWMLLVSVSGLAGLLHSAILVTFARGIESNAWLTVMCISFPYYLFVFAVGLAVLAGYVRWKTVGSFSANFQAMIKKIKITQNDIKD